MPNRPLRTLVFCSLLGLCGCITPASDDLYDSPAAGMLRIGDQVKGKGDLPTSIDFYQRAYTQDKKNLTAALRLATSLEEYGQMKEAGNVYAEAVKAHPESLELRRNYGRVLLGLDNPSEARRQYEQALQVDSDDVKSLSGLGVAFDHLGEHGKAQRQYKKALKAEPENLTTRNNLAYSYVLTRRYEAAINELEPQLSNPAATPALRQNLALAYGLSGRDEDAERVAKMDLPQDKVAQNIAYYKRQRAEMAVSSTPYAELGTYASEDQAVAQIEKLKPEVQKVGGYLKPVVMPEVTAPGEKPRFSVRMMGCSRPSDVDRLCKTLSDLDVPCVAKDNKEKKEADIKE